jgi:peptide deformylase
MVMVFGEENPIEIIYTYIEKNIDKTGIIPEWSTFIYNRLTDEGLLAECSGFSYSSDKNEPKAILMLSNQVNNELIMRYKMEGIKTHEIELPVKENVELSANATFVDLVEKYVIPNLQNEDCDYNIGDEISPSIKKPFFKGTRKCYLYPRQQVMAQGTVNALKADKKNVFLACGMGVGKTNITAAAVTAHFLETNKTGNTRVIVLAPGHLTPKWEREWTEYLSSQGITPKFYLVEKFTDIKAIPLKAEGFEIFLMPKDRVKRSYLQEFNTGDKYHRELLMDIGSFLNSLEKTLGADPEKKEIIVANYDKSISTMKLAAVKSANKFKTPVVLYKTILDSEGKVIGYKVAISARRLVEHSARLSYDFKVEDLNKFVSSLDVVEMVKEIKANNSVIQNGLTCPDCGGFIYEDALARFDKERWLDNHRTKPGTKSNKNNYHNDYVKADGTQLMAFEVEAIRDKKVKFIISTKKVSNPYVDMDESPITGEDLINVKSGRYTGEYQIVVRKCKHTLWGAVSKKGYNTVSAAEMMIKKFGKGSFDYLIADEAHVFQNMSMQGAVYATLCRLTKKRLNLTGTLSNGKSSSLFYMFYALFPEKMKRLGYKYEDVSLWIEHYGRRKEVTKEYAANDTYNKSGVGRRTSSGWNEIPGFSPLLYSNFLSDIMISRTIEDMAIPMPDIKYVAHKIEMDTELRSNYDNLQDEMLDFMKHNKGISLGGSYIHNLMAYPDFPQQEGIYAAGMLVANPKRINLEGKLLNKETKLVETVKKELQTERRTLVCATYSGEKGVTKRLVAVLRSQGINVVELTSSVALEKREAWIQQQYDNGTECIVTNPKIIETGLDIYGYPNIYIYESGWDIKTLRQCERRSWRIGQTRDCKVFYSYYINSIQEDCMKLIGSKKKSSLMLEGKFDEDFLSNMSSADDSGARMLFKMLEGKVSLKESELDAFGFSSEDEDEIIPIDIEKTVTTKVTTKGVKKTVEQTTLFTITEEDIANLSAKVKKNRAKKVAVGQMTFLDLFSEELA